MEIKETMNSVRKQFIETLFETGDYICAARELFETHLFSTADFIGSDSFQWVSVNPFKPGTRRGADFVHSYRNFLIESDNLELFDQEQVFETEYNLPFTTKVFSGNKSFHYIISLENSIDKESYLKYCKILKKAFFKYLDKVCLNPQCFTRLPASINFKTGNMQELIEVRSKIPNDKFKEWIESLNVKLTDNFFLNIEGDKTLFDMPEDIQKWAIDGFTRMNCENRHDKLVSTLVKARNFGLSIDSAYKSFLKAFVDKNEDKTEEEFNNILEWVYSKEK